MRSVFYGVLLTVFFVCAGSGQAADVTQDTYIIKNVKDGKASAGECGNGGKLQCDSDDETHVVDYYPPRDDLAGDGTVGSREMLRIDEGGYNSVYHTDTDADGLTKENGGSNSVETGAVEDTLLTEGQPPRQ